MTTITRVTLDEFLQSDRLSEHVDLREITIDEFRQWMIEEYERQQGGEMFRLQNNAANVLRRNKEALFDIWQRKDASHQAYLQDEMFKPHEKLTGQIHSMKRQLENRENFIEQAKSKKQDEKLAAKLQNNEEAIREGKASLEVLEKELEVMESNFQTRTTYLNVCDEEVALKARTGYREMKDTSTAFQQQSGRQAVKKGGSFEDLSKEACIKYILPSLPAREGCEVHILQNVGLGLHKGEIDSMVVYAKEMTMAANGNDASTSTGGNNTAGPMSIQQKRASSKEKLKTPMRMMEVVDVACIIECKRNPNDIARSFAIYQDTLTWLCGHRDKYSADKWKTKWHRSGHFECGEHTESVQNVKYMFTPESFASIADGIENEFIGHLKFITRPMKVIGLDSEIKGKIVHTLATSLHIEEDITKTSLSAWQTIFDKDIPSVAKVERNTLDVLKVYQSGDDRVKDNILFITSTEGD
eukprot:GFYU01006412.1.p1 GENE.GFYU01006412.1~~GFYU01006412.1.p1  ORF type:complete len:481 (-),score=128.03 GFYU01006412.1:340-1749(-)